MVRVQRRYCSSEFVTVTGRTTKVVTTGTPPARACLLGFIVGSEHSRFLRGLHIDTAQPQAPSDGGWDVLVQVELNFTRHGVWP